jgi:two-component system chemotaxis sensor kinase CheA
MPDGDAGPEGRKTILVADDERSMRELLGMLLEAEGYRTILAEDGLAALGILESSEESVDLVIQDIKMPRLDGLELLRRV